MARWQPETPRRLQDAGLELFSTRGYEQTTAADIAQRAGVTERTFFRHFRDKRDVLFHGQDEFTAVFVDGIDSAPAHTPPLGLIAAALRSAATFFPDERRERARTRQSVIDQHPALQERERHKMAGLATSVGQALRARGVPEPAATLAAESGATVFGIAFTTWIRPGERRSLDAIAQSVLGELTRLGTSA
ncbi:helix-turn-helix domain containing protein [Luteipulveratus sp. YIM 133132]|uniref:TetR/AcrR family transcriptional regulator n=1 Tax=Luteipulveratus flavus TaxID=3031728 RepID=UPI0023B04D42|nr:TetR/AcrR family transcriptional regulator [Luteipulveratus sp. YIM 133132]MDE9365729.1 helix-turn-helix domain containing protein [Luteipulveratus sp. YIM 133132]